MKNRKAQKSRSPRLKTMRTKELKAVSGGLADQGGGDAVGSLPLKKNLGLA